MNMKKVLAAVLAVMLAISAMAITAFADEYVIELSKESAATTTAQHSTVVFTIPVANKYGYVNSGDVLKLSLPTKTGTEGNEVDAKYFVTVNGVDYKLGLNDDGVYEITFGTLAHSWNEIDKNTCLPQATGVNAYTTLTVTGVFAIERTGINSWQETYRVTAADFKYFEDASENNWTNGKFATTNFWGANGIEYSYDVNANWNDESTSYCWDWNPADGADVSDIWDEYEQADLSKLHWDATFNNKIQILNAETATITVKFTKELVGEYYLGLVATYADGTKYELGSNFNNYYNEITKKDNYTIFAIMDKPADSVTFEIPVELLCSTNYNVFNEYVDITVYDTIHKTMMTTIDTIIDTEKVYEGTIGNYSWSHNASTDKTTYYFCGTQIDQYWNQYTGLYNCGGNDVFVESVYITLGTSEDDGEEIVETDTPVESNGEEVDTDDVDTDDVDNNEDETVNVEDKTEDTNPTTGIALAVVPMMVAAAAVVASKRR